MFCSPIHLMSDMTLWYNPYLFDMLIQSYRNFTNGDTNSYDCALTSAPCESNITKELVFSEPSFVYWFDLFVVYVALTLVSLVGIAANGINILVISTSNIATDSANNLYLWLSVSDLITALSCGAMVSVCFLCIIDTSVALSAFNMAFPYLLVNINKTSLLSLDFVTILSIQRAVAVILPFKISSIFSNRNTNIIITFLIFLNIFSSLPQFIGKRPDWIFHPSFDKEISLGAYYVIDYKLLINYINTYFYTRSAIDLALIFIAIPLTIAKLNWQGRSRSKMNATRLSSDSTKTPGTSKSVQEIKVIKMSVVVCVITFIIFCFSSAVVFIWQLHADKLYKTPAIFASTFGSVLITAIGSSFNFFLYLTMSTQYREAFTKMFRLSNN